MCADSRTKGRNPNGSLALASGSCKPLLSHLLQDRAPRALAFEETILHASILLLVISRHRSLLRRWRPVSAASLILRLQSLSRSVQRSARASSRLAPGAICSHFHAILTDSSCRPETEGISLHRCPRAVQWHPYTTPCPRLIPLKAVILVVAEPLQHSPFSGSFSRVPRRKQLA